MQARGRVDYGANDVQAAMPGVIAMSQLQSNTIAVAGATTWTAGQMLAGIIERTTASGAYIDTMPSVADLIAACPQLSVGDSFTLLFRNTIAQAMTLAVGTGWTLGSNTATAASLVREYLISITSNLPPAVFSAATTNTGVVLTLVNPNDIQKLQPGMVVSGTGIASGSKIIAVNQLAGTVTVDTAMTATGTNVAITANPTATITGVRSSTL